METVITRKERLAALRHDDFFVRSKMLHSFADDLDPDVEVSKQAIVTLEKYGWDDGFEFAHHLTKLAQDQDTVEWALSRILDRQFPVRSSRYVSAALHLAEWISEAPIALIEPHLDRLTESPEAPFESDPFGGKTRRPFKFGTARHRVELAGLTSGQCLNRLEEALAACHDPKAKKFPHAEAARLTRICERLGELGAPAEEQIREWLNHNPDSDPSIDDWRAGAAIQLVGFAKLGSADIAGKLVEMYNLDWDWSNELIPLALQRTGSRTALEKVIARYPELSWHARLYLCGVLEKLRFPETEAAVAGLLAREDADDLRGNIGLALAHYASPESLRIAEKVFWEHPHDRERFNIAETLYAYAKIRGEDRPELEIWRQKMEAQRRRIHDFESGRNPALPFLNRPPAPGPAPSRFKDVGRNDSCPCGSGKKFKKCCLLTAK